MLAYVEDVALRIGASGKDDIALVIPVPRAGVVAHLEEADIDIAEAGFGEIAGRNVELLVENGTGDIAVQ
jgi:hypothetical protein